MKKIIAFLTCLMMFLSTTVFAEANIPEELLKYPENFTASANVSISLDNNSDIRNLIEEIITTNGTVADIIGAEYLNFLTALFEYDGTVNVQADISPDYKKIKLSLTNNNVLSSVVSSNLNYTVKTNGGIWADIDLTNSEAPKCDVTLLLPTSNKYRYINAGKYITSDDINFFNEFLNPEELKKMMDESSLLLYNNSTIEKTKNGYKLSMNNDNLVAFISEISQYASNNVEIDKETIAIFKNMQFLGKDGITAVYTLKNGKISRSEMNADISVNISAIAKAIGAEWPYKSSGIININISEKINFTQVGSTMVKYPTLTNVNSISLNEIIDEQIASDYSEDYAAEYPYGYVEARSNSLPVINGDYYVPLRYVLEDGYGDSISIDYKNDVITASCEFFNGFNTLKITVGDDKIYVDDSEYALGKVMSIDGTTYVNTRLFTEVFGWEISNITHEILENTFIVGFLTYK